MTATRTDDTLRQTIARLRGHGKSMQGAPAYSRFVNRPLGRVIAAVAFRLGATPDMVTGVSALLSLAGIVTLAVAGPSVGAAVAVTLLLVLGYAFDSADGQLARLRGGGSPAGEWLDHVVDCAKISLLHVAVLVGLHGAGLSGGRLLVPLGFLVAANLYFFTFVLTDLLGRVERARTGSAAPTRTGRASVLRSLLVAPTDYGLLCLAFLLWAWPAAFVVVYGLLGLGTAGYVLLGLPKWRRDMRRLTAA